MGCPALSWTARHFSIFLHCRGFRALSCHEMNILNILMSTFCVCANGFLSRSFKCFSLLYTIINFLFASLKLLITFENAYCNPPQNFSVIGRCSLVWTSHWLQENCARINLSQAASGMILQNYRQLPRSIFQCQNLRFRVLEAGFWNDFQN